MHSEDVHSLRNPDSAEKKQQRKFFNLQIFNYKKTPAGNAPPEEKINVMKEKIDAVDWKAMSQVILEIDVQTRTYTQRFARRKSLLPKWYQI